MGRTPISAGPIRVLLPTKGHREIRSEPRVTETSATFVQTVGGRPLFSLFWVIARWPFLAPKPFTVWTTLELTINIDGSFTQRVIGSSPFPRHWLYDNNAQLVQKTALTRAQMWARRSFGRHTPWGGEDQESVVSGPETPVERALADTIMQSGQTPLVRNLPAGQFLFRQGDPGASVTLVLDGNLEVSVDGRVVAEVGPGAVVGERAWLEAGRRTADVRATTDIRVAEVPSAGLSAATMTELAGAPPPRGLVMTAPVTEGSGRAIGAGGGDAGLLPAAALVCAVAVRGPRPATSLPLSDLTTGGAVEAAKSAGA